MNTFDRLATLADRTITFFVPGFKVGGTNTLFARLAETLVSRFGLKVAVVDYPAGFVARALSEREVPHQLFSFTEDRPIRLPTDSFLVLDLSHGLLVDRWFIDADDVCCLLWSLHPANSLISFPLNYYYRGLQPKQTARLTSLIDRGRKKKVLTLLTRAHRANALVFMDSENYYWNKVIFGFADEPRYLPVPISEPQETDQTILPKKPGSLQLGWLGRLATDKIASVKALIASANLYARTRNQQITIHIIGRGSKESALDTVPVDERVTLTRCGTLLGDDLNSYMKTHIDILFGMGTSCLEGGRLQIPTVLVPLDYREIPLEHFKMMWLHETKDYLLGWHWTNPPSVDLQPFDRLVDSVASDAAALARAGRLCRDYVTTNHGIGNVADELIDLIGANRDFTVRDIHATGVLDYTPAEESLLWAKDQVKALRGR